MVSVKGFVTTCCGVPESVTVNVSAAVPAADGVPLIAPVEVLNVKPNGSVPVNCQVRAPVPPVAVSVCEYGTATIPSLSAVVVIFSGGIWDTIVTIAVAVCGGAPESVTLNVTGAVPTPVGVPLTTPVAASNVKPAGSVPESNCQ
jgi:hypothetical protein